MSSSPLNSLVVLLLVASTARLVLVGAEETGQSQYDYPVGIRLKEQVIPSNGSGVVIFDDIGGFLGPQDGLLCIVDKNFSEDSSVSYWAKPDGAQLNHPPGDNELFGINYHCFNLPGIALYYSERAKPEERGLFECVIAIDTNVSGNASVHIVDMSMSDPVLIGSDPNGPIVAGDNISICVNLTTTPDDTPIPHQWRLNGKDLQLNDSTYQGVQTNQLMITNVQARHQGEYTCQVAHSASGITKSVTLSVISITVQLNGTPTTNDAKIGKHFVLTCNVLGDDNIQLQGLARYTWFKDGEQMEENKSTYTFNQLVFEDAGHYMCQVSMTFGERLVKYESNDFSLTIPMVTYQIYLKLAKDEKCSVWTETGISNKVDDIETQICRGIKNTCNLQNTCDSFIKNDSHVQRGYKCPNQLSHTVLYDVILKEIAESNTTYLIDCLEEWIHSDALTRIPLNGVQLRIDKSCCRVLDKQNTPECSRGSTLTMAHGLIIGFGVSGVVVLLIVIIIGMAKCMRKRSNERSGYKSLNKKGS